MFKPVNKMRITNKFLIQEYTLNDMGLIKEFLNKRNYRIVSIGTDGKDSGDTTVYAVRAYDDNDLRDLYLAVDDFGGIVFVENRFVASV